MYGDYEMMDEHGALICRVRPPPWSEWLFARGRFVPMQPSTFWRRSVAGAVGELDPSLHYCMDVDFFARASHLARFAYVPELLGRFRMHGDTRPRSARSSAGSWRNTGGCCPTNRPGFRRSPDVPGLPAARARRAPAAAWPALDVSSAHPPGNHLADPWRGRASPRECCQLSRFPARGNLGVPEGHAAPCAAA